jgi:hypothetical protein
MVNRQKMYKTITFFPIWVVNACIVALHLQHFSIIIFPNEIILLYDKNSSS